MPTEAQLDDVRKFLEQSQPKPPQPPQRWRPQLTLGSLILLVMLVALSAAFIANNRVHKQELAALQKKHVQEVAFQDAAAGALSFLTNIPNHQNLGFVRVFAYNNFSVSRSEYSLQVYLHPEKAYLLHHATQAIPASGYPAAQTTYHIPVIGDKQHSRNLVHFVILCEGPGHHYHELDQPFKGEVIIKTYYANFSHAGGPGMTSHRYWLPKPLLSGPLTVQKEQQTKDWIYLLLDKGYDTTSIVPQRPTQLLRIRSIPADPEPGPGVMLWIEELGDAKVPHNALPFLP